jgi:hypothetical protein
MTVVRKARKAGVLFGGREPSHSAIESPEVCPIGFRKGAYGGKTRGKQDEGDDRFVRQDGGSALEARKLRRARSPRPELTLWVAKKGDGFTGGR